MLFEADDPVFMLFHLIIQCTVQEIMVDILCYDIEMMFNLLLVLFYLLLEIMNFLFIPCEVFHNAFHIRLCGRCCGIGGHDCR